MDAGHEVAGADEEDNADHERGHIQQQDEGYVQQDGSLADIISLRVKGDEASDLL